MQYDEYAIDKGYIFELQHESDSIITWFDEDKVEKIIMNLMSNAFKYSQDNGKITLKLSTCIEREYLEYVKIEVIDTGIGIDKKNIDKIFDRFFKVDSLNTEMQGSGIGLSLTKSLVELHKGKIYVDSKKDEGTCFTVLLPKNERFSNNDEIMVEKGSYPKYAFNNKNNFTVEPQKYTPDYITFDPSKKSILVVEDNKDMCYFIYDLISNEYNIEIAHNGKQAIEYLEQDNKIELVLSDIMMPEMDGICLCRQIKKNVNTSHLPVVLLTAKQDNEAELEGLKTGADDYITKPFNEEVLKVKLANILAFRDNLRKKYTSKLSIEPSEITTTSKDEAFIKKAIGEVEKNMSNYDYNIRSLACSMAMSPSTLLRKFKAITGDSTDKFIRTIRLKRAAQLLQKSQFTVTEICYDVGFSSQKHFSTTFKKLFELTPSEYRRQFNEVDKSIKL